MGQLRVLRTSSTRVVPGWSIPLVPPGGVLGRDPAAEYVLHDPMASRRHVRLASGGEGWVAEDAGSVNGLVVNGRRVRRHRLASGDRILVGGTELEFLDGSGPPAEAGSPDRAEARGRGRRSSALPRRRTTVAILLLAGAVLLPLGAAGAVALVLTRGGKSLRLLPAIASSVARNGWSGRLDPAPAAWPDTPAVDLRPLPGVRIHAPAGALDRPRTFRVARAPSDRASALERELEATGGSLVAAFEVDAGMGDDERFAGDVSVSVDLSALGVPAALVEHASLRHVLRDGSSARLKTTRDGSVVRGSIRHNEVIAITLAIGVPAAFVVANHLKFGPGPWSTWETDGFVAYWPASEPPRDPATMEKVQGELRALWQEHLRAHPPSDRPSAQWQPFADFLERPRVRELNGLLRDRAWVEAHYLPIPVAEALRALERSYAYLAGASGRGFRGTTFKTDVLLQSEAAWANGPGVVGIAVTHGLLYPWIELRYSRLPESALADGPTEAHDELYCTAVHELFHVLQKGCYSGEPAAYLWFLEATAEALEAEAAEAFRKAGWVRHPRAGNSGAQRAAAFGPLDLREGDEERRRRHGYGSAPFLELLRERYYGAARLAFLPALMKDFSSVRGGTVASLRRVTSDSDRALGEDFALYAARDVEVLRALSRQPDPDHGYLPEMVTVTPRDPVAAWPVSPARPLAARFLPVRLAPAAGTPPPTLLLRGNGLEGEGLLVRFAAGRQWSKLGREDVPVTPASSDDGPTVWLQRIETYVEPPQAPGPRGRRTTAVGLFSPPPPQRVDVSPRNVHVAWPPSALVPLHYVKSYIVSAGLDGGGPSREFVAEGQRLAIDVEKAIGRPASEGDVLVVAYRERIVADGYVYGPWSVPLRIPLQAAPEPRPTPAASPTPEPAPTPSGGAAGGRWVRTGIDLVEEYPDSDAPETGTGGDGVAACEAKFHSGNVGRARFGWTSPPETLLPGGEYPMEARAADAGSSGPNVGKGPGGAAAWVELRCTGSCSLRMTSDINLFFPGPPNVQTGTLRVDAGRSAEDRLRIDAYTACGLRPRRVVYKYAWRP